MNRPLARVRLALIGAGQISRYAATAFARQPSVRLIAVADPDPTRAGELAREFSIGRVYSDAIAMLESEELDAVYIAAPNVFHAPLALAAFERRLHVLLEKPFALTAAEAQTVADAAQASGRVLSVSMNQRFRRDSQLIRALVRKGELGDVYHARAYWFRRSGIPRLGTWFGKRQWAGGGALLDIGVHLLDLALFILGNFRPVSVSGAVHSTFGHRGLGEGGWGRSDPLEGQFDVDDFATALVRFENGATLSLDASWAMHQPTNEEFNLLLHGSLAGAGCYPAETYRFGVGPGAPYERAALVPALPEKISFPHESPYDNFVNHLLGTEPLCVTADEALAVQRVLDAIYRSAAEGREVSLVMAP